MSSAVLLCVIILGILFRVYYIGYRSFWLDELYSVSYAKLSIGSLFNVLHTNNQMPLYSVLLHVWIRIFGDSDLPVRALSILFAVMGIMGLYYLLRRGLGWPLHSCLMGVALLAVNPFHIYYSIEARPYSLLFALSAFYLAALALMHTEGDKKYSLAYGFLQALLFYTHPTALIYCACINVTYLFLLFLLGAFSWPRIKNLLMACLVTTVIFSPAITMLIHQAGLVHETFWAKLSSPFGALKTWLSITLFWSPELVDFLASNVSSGRTFIWICIVLPVLLLMGRGSIYGIRRKRLVELLSILSLFVYPATIYLVSILFKPILMNRIFIPSLIGLLILIAIAEEKHSSDTKTATSLLFLLFLMISISLSFAVTNINKSPDWRDIAAAISQRAKPEDFVLVYKSQGASLLKRYYKGTLEIKGATHDFEEEIRLRELRKYNSGRVLGRPFFSRDVLERFDRLTAARERFFMVFQSLSNEEVLLARDFILKRYRVREQIMVGPAEILLLSSPLPFNP